MSRSLVIVVLLGALLTSSSAWAGNKEEERRKALLEQLGLDPAETKKDPDADKGKTPPPEEPADDGEQPPADEATSGKGTKGKPSARVVHFQPNVHRVLMQRCQRCHQPGKNAAKSGFVLTGDVAADYESARSKAGKKPGATSPLLAKVFTKPPHKKPPIAAGSADAKLIEAWLTSGAHFGGKPATATADASTAQAGAKTGTVGKGTNPAASDAAVPEDATTVAGESWASGPVPVAGPPASSIAFAPGIHQLLIKGCAECHAPGEFGAGEYVAYPDVDAHYTSARALVTVPDPEKSRLYQAALGQHHDGDLVFAEGSVEAQRLAAWIAEGALLKPAAAPVASGEIAPSAEAVGAPTSSSEPLVSPQPVLEKLAELSPMLAGLSLHGRFDLSYERRGYTGNPLAEGAVNALRSYHHFIFLGRHTATDPFGLDVELTSLQFWELSARFNFGPVALGAKAGKLMVPFGAEPLYHHSYGGLAAFDQKILPVVWAQEGVRGFANVHLGGLGLSADAYVVRGYNLRNEDSVINLQADFAPLEDVKLAAGARLGLGFGPVSMRYSSYVNPLDYERLLFMQAFDVGVWRMRGVPVLQDMAVSFGAMRADISGGGPGLDYFHFGSYFQFRYYPLDFLYFQYRQGLRTFENKGGLWLDDLRLTADDASTHSVGMVGTWRGLSVGLWHFWNLEKVDEQPDDFFRATVGYAF